MNSPETEGENCVEMTRILNPARLENKENLSQNLPSLLIVVVTYSTKGFFVRVAKPLDTEYICCLQYISPPSFCNIVHCI
jgi:hypothetical protein